MKLIEKFRGMNHIPCSLHLGFWYESQHKIILADYGTVYRLTFVWNYQNNANVISQKYRVYELSCEEYKLLYDRLGPPSDFIINDTVFLTYYVRYMPKMGSSPYRYHYI